MLVNKVINNFWPRSIILIASLLKNDCGRNQEITITNDEKAEVNHM